MTVRHGREFLSIPGPTTVPDEVLAAMHRPAVDIYAGELLDVTNSCLGDLRRIFRTEGQTYIYAANGHGAWEAALTNVLSRGNKVLVLASGLFGPAWGEMASMLGLEVEILGGNWRQAIDPADVEARLRCDANREIKAVLVVQVDTASGVANDIAAICHAIHNAGSDAIFMVDTIASLATMPFEMDRWGVDVAIAGSQKGLMMPPGLSFIAANAKARAAHPKADLRTQYWDWTLREGAQHYQKYCGTPPEHALFGMRKALDMLLEEGLENVIQRHRVLAKAVHATVDRWSESGPLEANVVCPSERAHSVTTVLMNGGRDPNELRSYCREKCGVVIGITIGGLDGKGFRIAHMGHVNAPMILGTLSVVETGLKALSIPHGSGGIQRAIETIAEEVVA